MQKEELNKARAEYKNRVKARGSENYDSGMPVTEGAILSIYGYKTENAGTAMEYTNFLNQEGAILSDKHIGRRGNGLGLEGSTNEERTCAFMDEIDSLEEGSFIKIKVVKILYKKALYDGRESLQTYYIMERV